MRLFKSFSVLLLLIFSADSYAQYAGASASAYAGASVYPGQGGGMQACPYPQGGGNSGGGTEAERLRANRDELGNVLEDIVEEQEEIMSGDHERFDDDTLPLKPEVREGLITMIESDIKNLCRVPETEIPNPVSIMFTTIGPEFDPNCAEGGSGTLRPDDICNSPNAYVEAKNISRSKQSCKKMLDKYETLEKSRKRIEKAYDTLDEKLYELEEAREKRQLEAMISGKPLPPEGVCTTGDCYGSGSPEPQIPGGKQIFAAGLADLMMGGLWYYGTKYVTKENQKLGWATPPTALGIPAASASAALWSRTFAGGSGSIGCSPAGGYNHGPNGGYGNPMGSASPYGACGGAFASPCSAYGNPSFGGQYGPGGYGGYGGGYPGGPGFGVTGAIGVGGGFPMGGMGGFPMGGMMGNPYFPGSYPGGYGAQGGFGGGLGGMGGGYGPMGGMGGGYGSPYGMNPYMNGGMAGGMYGGMPGMYGGVGGGYGPGGMPGMYGGAGGMYGGNPYGIGGGYPNMYGGVGGGMNAQVIGSQIYGLGIQRDQITMQINYLSGLLYGGGGGGVYGGAYIGGGAGGGPIPYPGYGSGSGGSSGTPSR